MKIDWSPTVNGTSPVTPWTEPVQTGHGYARITGTDYGSGTVALQWTPDKGVTWLTVADTEGDPISATTGTVEARFYLPNGGEHEVRFILSGATSPEGMRCLLGPIL